MPEKRPQIPAELRRLVLVEAGHRCAIHTCRHQDVDLHHIIPWAKAREHQFDNLIALCPNCHRRAEAGEIDRKALKMYKARLAAAFDFQGVSSYPFERNTAPAFAWVDPAARWRTFVDRLEDPERKLSIELEYPELSTSLPGAAQLNVLLVEKVKGLRDEFVHEIDSDDFKMYPSSIGYWLNSSFAVSLMTDELISIRFKVYSFAGGAHGYHWTEVVNFRFSTPHLLKLGDLFEDLEEGLQILSSYCISELIVATDERDARHPHAVQAGAAPLGENFQRFNLAPSGILVSFDTYTVGSYAEGPSEVLVPYSVLRPVLKLGFSWGDRPP